MPGDQGSNARFGLVGAGGFGREVMALAQLADHHSVFVESEPTHAAVNGHPCVSVEEFLQSAGRLEFNIAIADSAVRARLAEHLEAHGATPRGIRARSAVVLGSCTIGAGEILCDFAMVSANSEVGAYFHANYYSYVAHDCVIGNFVTLAPRASVNGNVWLGDHVYVGAGAIIKQGTAANPLKIGEGAIIGMGAVVTKNVEPHTTVVGNPARPLTS
jgi:sugar O-acyltransferase (sialic acid O-acetyltransferase NeuD family)